MNFKYAIFDMDGTLIDSMYFWRDVLVDCIEEVHGVKFTSEQRNFFVTIPYYELALKTKEYKGVDIDSRKILSMCYERMEKIYSSGKIQIKPYALDFLALLKSKGIGTALATATKKEICLPYLEQSGLLPYLDHIYTEDDAKISKRISSRVYDLALQALGGTKEDTVVFEDVVDCIKTAKSNGYRVIAVSDVCQGNSVDEIIKTADRFINTYKELME